MNSYQLYNVKPKFEIRLPPAYNSEDSELSGSDADLECTPPEKPIFYDLFSDSTTSDSKNEAPGPSISSTYIIAEESNAGFVSSFNSS